MSLQYDKERRAIKTAYQKNYRNKKKILKSTKCMYYKFLILL